MTSDYFDPFKIPLVGREALLATAAEALGARPGCLVVVGEPKAGVTRVAMEIMQRAGEQGVRLIWTESGQQDAVERLQIALRANGLPSDLAAAATAEPFAAYLGSCDAQNQGRLMRALSGTAGVVICEAIDTVAAPSVRVNPLGPDPSAEVVAAIDPSGDVDLRSRIVRLGDGLPGCLVSLTRGRNLVRLPPDLEELVHERLTGLDDDACHAVLYWAAVLGEFDEEAVVAVAGSSHSETVEEVARLVRRGVLTRDSRPPYLYEFVHELTRWAIADRALWGFRVPASATDASVARAVLDERRRLIGLADAAVRPRIVLHHAEAGLQEWRPERGERVRLELLHDRARSLEREFRVGEALNVLKEVESGFEQLGDIERVEQARQYARNLRSRLWERQATFDELRVLHDAIEATASAEDLSNQAAAALVALRAIRHAEAIDIARRVLDHPRDAMSMETWMNARVALMVSRALIEPTRENADALDALRLESIELGFVMNAVVTTNFLATVLGDLHSDYANAESVSRSTATALRSSGDVAAAGFVELVLGLILLEAGQIRRASELMATWKWEQPEHGPVDFRDFSESWLARIRGDVEVPEAARIALMGSAGENPDLLIGYATQVLLSHAGTKLEVDDEALVLRALTVCDDDLGSLALKLFLLVGAIEADLEPGRNAWQERLEYLAQWGAPGVNAYRRYAAAFFEPDPDRALRMLREASAELGALGIGWWSARACLMAGLLGTGEAAASDLRAARGAFEAMGATGWRERVEAELRSRGLRWSTRSSGSGVLSAREMEVVRELLAGSSNAQIAERLVLSENTVARHLTRVYRKLGVSGRAEAVEAAQIILDSEHT